MSKDFLKTSFSAGISFGIIMGLFSGIVYGIYFGIVSGIILGFLFGIGMGSFTEIQKKKFKKNSSDITNNKKVIMDGGANHFKGIESVGGWVYLTSEDIIFKSHVFNVQVHETIIPLNQIVEAKTISTLGFIPNGLQIIIKNGIVEKFIVNNRKTWVKKINEEIYLYNCKLKS